jgi:hypothetical protein
MLNKKATIALSASAATVVLAVVAAVLALTLRKQTSPCESTVVASDGKQTCLCPLAHAGPACDIDCPHVLDGDWHLNTTLTTFGPAQREVRHARPLATWFDALNPTLDLAVGMWNPNSDQVTLVVDQGGELTEMNVDYFLGHRANSCFVPPHSITLSSGDTLTRQLTPPTLLKDDVQITACAGDACEPNTSSVIIPLTPPPFQIIRYTVTRTDNENTTTTWDISSSLTQIHDTPPPGDHTYKVSYTLEDGTVSPPANLTLNVPLDLQPLCPDHAWDSVAHMCDPSSAFDVNLAPLIITFDAINTPLLNQNGIVTWPTQGVVATRHEEEDDRLWFDSQQTYTNPTGTFPSLSLGFKPTPDGGIDMRLFIYVYEVDFSPNSEEAVTPDPNLDNNFPKRMGSYIGGLIFPTQPTTTLFSLTHSLTAIGQNLTLNPTNSQASLLTINMAPEVNIDEIQIVTPAGADAPNKHLILPCEQMCLDINTPVPTICATHTQDEINEFLLTYTLPQEADPNFLYTPITAQNGRTTWVGPPISQTREDNEERLWFDTVQTSSASLPSLSLGFRLDEVQEAMTVRIILNPYRVNFIQDSDNVVLVDDIQNSPPQMGTHTGTFTFPTQTDTLTPSQFSLSQGLRQINNFQLEHDTDDTHLLLTLSPQCASLGGYNVYIQWTGIQDASYDLDRVDTEQVSKNLLSDTKATNYLDENLPYDHKGGTYVVRYTGTDNVAFTFVGPQTLAKVYCSARGDYVFSNATCDCPQTYGGPSCNLACQGNGYMLNETCQCADPDNVDQVSCAYTRDATCSGHGDPTTTGLCVCDDPDRQNSACAYTDLDTCNGNGVPDANGHCACTNPTIVDAHCAYTNLDTCNGNGVPDANGVCLCDDPTHTNSSCAYTREHTCNGEGFPDDDGGCTCDEPYRVADDHCVYTRASACTNQGHLVESNTCECDTGFTELMNEVCAYTNEHTCSGAGTVASTTDSTCTCDPGFSGPSCEVQNTYYGCELEAAPLDIADNPIDCGNTCSLVRGNWKLSTDPEGTHFTFGAASVQQSGAPDPLQLPSDDEHTRIWYLSDQLDDNSTPRIALGFRDVDHVWVEVVAVVTQTTETQLADVTNILYGNRDECMHALLFAFQEFSLAWSPGSATITDHEVRACDADNQTCTPFVAEVELTWTPPVLEHDVTLTSYTLTRTHVTNTAEFSATFDISASVTSFVDPNPNPGINTYTLNFTADFQRQTGLTGDPVGLELTVPAPSQAICAQTWDQVTGLCTATPFTMLMDDVQSFFTRGEENYPVPNNDHGIVTFTQHTSPRIESRTIEAGPRMVAVFDSDQLDANKTPNLRLAFTPLSDTRLWVELQASLGVGDPFTDFSVDYNLLDIVPRVEDPMSLDPQTYTTILEYTHGHNEVSLLHLLTQPLQLNNEADDIITLRTPTRVLPPLYVSPLVFQTFDAFDDPRNAVQIQTSAVIPTQLTDTITLLVNHTTGADNTQRPAWKLTTTPTLTDLPHTLTFDTVEDTDGILILKSTQKDSNQISYVTLTLEDADPDAQPSSTSTANISVVIAGDIDEHMLAYPTPWGVLPPTIVGSAFTLTSYDIVDPGDLNFQAASNETHTYNFYYAMADSYPSEIVTHTLEVGHLEDLCKARWSDLTQQCFPELNVTVPALQLARMVVDGDARAVTQDLASIITFHAVPENTTVFRDDAQWDTAAVRRWFTSTQNYQIFDTNEAGELSLLSQHPTLQLGFRYLPSGRMEMAVIAHIYTNDPIGTGYVLQPPISGSITASITFDAQFTEFFSLEDALTTGNPDPETPALAKQTDGYTFGASRLFENTLFEVDLRMVPADTPPPPTPLAFLESSIAPCIHTNDNECVANTVLVTLRWEGPQNTPLSLERTRIADGSPATLLSLATFAVEYIDTVEAASNYTYSLYPTYANDFTPVTRIVIVPTHSEVCTASGSLPESELCKPLESITTATASDPVINYICSSLDCANEVIAEMRWETGLNPDTGIYDIKMSADSSDGPWTDVLGGDTEVSMPDLEGTVTYNYPANVTDATTVYIQFTARDDEKIIHPPLITTLELLPYSEAICATHPADNAWGHEGYDPQGFCTLPTPQENNDYCMSAPDTFSFYGTLSHTCSPLSCSLPLTLQDGTSVLDETGNLIPLYADHMSATDITKFTNCACNNVGDWDEANQTCLCSNENAMPGYWNGHTCNYASEYCGKNDDDGTLNETTGICTWPAGWVDDDTEITACVEDICAGTRRVDMGIVFPFDNGDYYIERQVDSGPWTQVEVGSFTASTVSFEDDVPAGDVGGVVKYQVRADGTGDDSFKKVEWTTKQFANDPYTEVECNALPDDNPLTHRIRSTEGSEGDYCGLPTVSELETFCGTAPQTRPYWVRENPFTEPIQIYDPSTNKCEPVTAGAQIGNSPTLGPNGRALTQSELESSYGVMNNQTVVDSNLIARTYSDIPNGIWEMWDKQEPCFHGSLNSSNTCDCDDGWGGNQCQFEHALFCNGVGTIPNTSGTPACECPYTLDNQVGVEYDERGYVGDNCQNNLCSGYGTRHTKTFPLGASIETCVCDDGTTTSNTCPVIPEFDVHSDNYSITNKWYPDNEEWQALEDDSQKGKIVSSRHECFEICRDYDECAGVVVADYDSGMQCWLADGLVESPSTSDIADMTTYERT